MKDFDELLTWLPHSILHKLELCKLINERNDYHPEANTYEHIKIVVNKLCSTGNIDMILAGLFHDLWKYDAAKACNKNHYKKNFDNGNWYNMLKKDGGVKTYLHAEFCERNIHKHKDFIVFMGADFDNVKEICANHMRTHQFDKMKPSKQKRFRNLKNYNNLLIFADADNMVGNGPKKL